MEVLPGCQEDREEEREVRKLNRNKRPKLTTSEIGRLETCDRPLAKGDWGEMSIDRQWGALEVMGLLKEEQSGEKDVTIDATQTTSPKPPPKAPWEVKKFAADPSASSRNYLGEKEAKGYDAQ